MPPLRLLFLCACGLALLCLCVFVCVVERERESGGTRERERDWLADRRRWRETTTTSIQEGLSSSSKQAVGVDAASESGRARRLCVCDERRQDNNNGAGL